MTQGDLITGLWERVKAKNRTLCPCGGRLVHSLGEQALVRNGHIAFALLMRAKLDSSPINHIGIIQDIIVLRDSSGRLFCVERGAIGPVRCHSVYNVGDFKNPFLDKKTVLGNMLRIGHIGNMELRFRWEGTFLAA